MFIKSYGASGLVKIIAPFPSFEAIESPMSFIATIRAWILEPHGSMYGEVLSVDIFTKQIAVLRIVESVVPSQFKLSTLYVVASLYLISIL